MKKLTGRLIILILAPVMALILVHAIGVVSAATTEPLVQATFSTNPTVTAPGNDGYIQLTLKNAGTVTASRIKISRVSFDSDIIPSGDWVSELSPLGAGDSVTSLFKFKVSETASSGLHVLTFYIDYGVDSISRTINPNAIVNVQSPSALELTSISPSSLRPGEKTNMTFTIANKGGSSIGNVVFTWTSSDNTLLPLGSDNRVVIPLIGANSYYDIQTQVSVNPSATAGVYPLSISIQYIDKSGANQTISSTAGIEVGGGTDFDVSIQDSTSGTTTLAIANIGANTAYSAIVSIPQQENFRASGTSTSVIGNLDAGDYTLVNFQIASTRAVTNISTNQGMNQPSTIQETNQTSTGRGKNLIVEISYTDTLGVRRTIQKEVSQEGISLSIPGAFGSRTVSQSSGIGSVMSGNGGLLYIIIGIVGITAIVVFLKFRKRLKRKKE